MTDRVGQRLDTYQLIRLLGTGSFGEVYLAEHVYRKNRVAVKVLPQLADSDLQSFLNEARSVRLKHPHIVQVRDFGVDKDNHVPFIVMDYAPHGTLRQRYPKGTHLPIASIVTYVGQIASALQYAHDERLIHRDIKPENLLVGTRSEVLVSDFGIATIARSSRSRSLVEMAGTVAYMAPEQVQGKPDVASDQYALAIIVYEWLCGERPFNGTPMEIAVQQMVTAPAPLREKVPDLSPEIEQVVMKALAKDPKDRFVSVQAFAVALEQAHEWYRLSLLPRSTAVHPVVSIELPSGPVSKSRKQRPLLLLTLALSILFIFSSFGGIYYLKLSLPDVDQKFNHATSLIDQANPDKDADAVDALQKLVAAQNDLRSAQDPFFTGPQADRFVALQNSLESKGKQAITNYNEHSSIFSLCNTIANTSVLNLTGAGGQSPLIASVQQGQTVSSYLLAGDSSLYLLNGQKSQKTKASLPNGTVPFLLASNGQRLFVVTKQAGQGSNTVSYALHVYKPGANGALADDSNSPRPID
ncbi:MAG TPA: serine/threonine-protein kinase, partial [Ktedonobacteraceae bacterium]